VAKSKRRLLGEILMDKGLISEEQIRQALRHQQEKGMRIGEALVELGYVDGEDVTYALAEQFDFEVVDLQAEKIPIEAIEAIPKSVSKQHNVVPIGKEDGRLTVAIADPLDLIAIDNITIKRFIPIVMSMTNNNKITWLEAAGHAIQFVKTGF